MTTLGRAPGQRTGVTAAALLTGGMICFGSATPVSAIVGRGFPLWLAASLRLIVAVVSGRRASAWRRRPSQVDQPPATPPVVVADAS